MFACLCVCVCVWKAALTSAQQPFFLEMSETIVSVCETCRKSEYKDGVKLKRCGKCKNVFYCSAECQKKDWSDHSYQCRKPDVVLRKEAEKPFMGIPNAYNVPVDVDEKGELDFRPLVQRIKEDQARIGKEKVAAPPKPVTWAYKPPETEEEREERMQAFEQALDKSAFKEAEWQAFEVMSSDDKDFIWSVWQLFIEKDTRLPLVRANTRCVREILRLLGSQERYRWIAEPGNDWVGAVQGNDHSKDAVIQALAEKVTREDLDSKSEDYDCTLFVRLLCALRKRNAGASWRNFG